MERRAQRAKTRMVHWPPRRVDEVYVGFVFAIGVVSLGEFVLWRWVAAIQLSVYLQHRRSSKHANAQEQRINLRNASNVLSPDATPGFSPNASSFRVCFANPFIGAAGAVLVYLYKVKPAKLFQQLNSDDMEGY